MNKIAFITGSGAVENAWQPSMMYSVDELKSKICNGLLLAEKKNKIKARKEFEAILYKFIF